MTDYSGWTDEQVNEAIAVKRGWKQGRVLVGLSVEHTRWTDGIVQQRNVPDYTHSWELCGELLEEMKDKCLVSLMNGRLDNPHWVCGIFANPRVISTNASTPQRAICEAWLAWKEAD